MTFLSPSSGILDRWSVRIEIAFSHRSGISASVGIESLKSLRNPSGNISGSSVAAAARSDHGFSNSTSRPTLLIDARAASVQNSTSPLTSAVKPSDLINVRAMSARVLAWDASSSSLVTTPAGVVGASRSETKNVSSSLSSRCRLTVWVCRSFVRLRSDSRVSISASAIPAVHAEFTKGRLLISLHALPTAIRCPARFPLSTEEMYFGSSGRRS